MTAANSPTRSLRALTAQGTVALPGAFNALSARQIERAGFTAAYVSGAVLANSVGGVPDVGLMTLGELTAHVAGMAGACRLPLLVDADTGFGAEGNAARTVRELERAGASGLHLEDQEFPKRCGHLPGKRLVPVEEFCAKLAAAAAARTNPDLLIIARTDARGVAGYDEAVCRAQAYLAAGADGIFPEALTSAEEFARFARDVPTLLLANCTEFGHSPLLSVDACGEMGYRLVIFPVTLQRLVCRTVERALATLRSEGTQANLLPEMMTRQELYDLLGYDPLARPQC